MVNIVVLWKGKAIFWNTLLSKYGKAASVVIQLLKKAVSQIEHLFKVGVDSIVANNENANKTLFGLIRD